jgi:hypothetical protein
MAVTESRQHGERGGDGGAGDEEQRYAPECYACPIGTVSMAMQRSAPDATQHLLRAGREMVLAVRDLLDGVAEVLNTIDERSEAARGRSTRVESIPIRRGRTQR